MGFAAGLVSDVLPPAAHLLGQYALVLCLIGFIAGRAPESRPDAGPLVALACAVAGPLFAVVTGAHAAATHGLGVSMLTTTLPQAMLYNLLAAPPWCGRCAGSSGDPWRGPPRSAGHPAEPL